MMRRSSAERKYQIEAQKRTEAARKIDFYNQTARYFERESLKAQHYNTWNVSELKPTYWENIRKSEALQTRRNQLESLLKKEEEQYKAEFEQSKPKRHLHQRFSLEDLQNKLKEQRLEQSLYNPTVSRRLQTYLSYPSQSPRFVLREINKSRAFKPVKMSLENTNIRSDEFNDEISPVTSPDVVDNAMRREEFNVRAEEFKENQSNSRFSHFTSIPNTPNEKNHLNSTFKNPTTPKSEDKHDYGKYAERYSHNSLEHTNLEQPDGNFTYPTNKDNAKNGHGNEKKNSFPYGNIPNRDRYLNKSIDDVYSKPGDENLIYLSNDTHVKQETDDMVATENFHHQKNEENHHEFSRHYFDESDLSRAMDNVSLSEEKVGEFPDQMPDKFEKSDNQVTSDGAKALPPSNMMFMYLTQQMMKQKIADLEAREQRATMKHHWEEALRLREMKDRMMLLREQQIYQHHDLPIDAESKQLAVDGIEVRMQQLLNRRKLCDTLMFSEEAKMLWDKWVEEDKKSHTTTGHDGSVTLLEQLQEEWMAMAEAEKQKISESYQHEMAATSDEDKMMLINKTFARK